MPLPGAADSEGDGEGEGDDDGMVLFILKLKYTLTPPSAVLPQNELPLLADALQ